MTRPAGPLPAWADLGCAAEELCRATGALLRGQDDALAMEVRSGRVSARALQMLLERHRMGAWLHHRLSASPLQTAVPSSFREQLEAAAVRQRATAEACRAALADLLPRFDAAGVPAVVLKGPALAERYYGGLAHRGYGDLDLLVPEAHRDRADTVLRAAGYHRVSRALLGERLTARFVHGFDYRGGPVGVDLHWCLSRVPGYRLDMGGIWARMTPVEIDHLPCRVMAPEDELHFLLLSTFADAQRGALRLQSLVDIATVLSRQPTLDWAAFLAVRGAERTEDVCRAMLSLLLGLLELDVEFPALASALGGAMPTPLAQAVMQSTRGALGAKAWSMRALPISPLRYVAWWSLSLPFRMATSHPRWRRPLPASA